MQRAPTGESAYPQKTIAMTGVALGEALDLSRAGPPQIPGFRLKGERPLGSGAFGQVWEAEKTDDGRICAVKIFTRTGGLDWGRLEREVKILTRIDEHPHIVNLIHANLAHESWPFYAMYLLRGGSLEARIHPRDPEGRLIRNPLLIPIDKALLWFRQVADAMRFAHGKGILHCDLKPANVMLDDEGNVKLVDFGQSRLLKGDGGSLGTLDYMAPEQAIVASNEDAPPMPDVRWDIYSFGVLMYETLTRQLPRADGPDRPKVRADSDLREMLSDYRKYLGRTRLTPVRRYRPEVDEDLAAIVEKCLCVDPPGRYESFEALLADFDAREQHRPLAARAHDRVYLAKHFLKRRVWSAVFVLVIAGLILWYQSDRDWYQSDRDRARADLTLFRGVVARQTQQVARLSETLAAGGQTDLAWQTLEQAVADLESVAHHRAPNGSEERRALAQSCLDLRTALMQVKGNTAAPQFEPLDKRLRGIFKTIDASGELTGDAQFAALRG
ncbi:MAG TPA: serine/threonine-protein kinase [Phycisphaerae bacterium]